MMPLQFPYGLLQLPLWGYVVFTFVMVQVMLLGVTLYLHRDQSHGGLVLHPAVRHFFRFWLWFSAATVTREWVAVHRRHHAFADRPGDPHSPVVFGLRRVVLGGYELYAAAARDPKILANYGRGTPDDWLERNLYSRFPVVGISVFITLQMILFGVPAITMIGVQLIAQPLLAAGIINGLGHHLGYRSFEVPNSATNILPWGLLIAGEELHNNHHAFPASPCFAVQPWEFDLGWLIVRLLRSLGLARVGSLAPSPSFVQEPVGISADTVKALFKNRLHVLRDYRRRVVAPVLRELKKAASITPLAPGASRLLRRHPQLLDAKGHLELGKLLDQHEVLRTVIEFRNRLQQVWDENSASHGRALEQLRQLCTEGESSRICQLRRFAQSLATYASGSPAA